MAMLLANQFELLIETWDDPGDYPSGAGAGPLPSQKYIAGMEGETQYSLRLIEATAFLADATEYVNQTLSPDLPDGIQAVTEWEWKLERNPAIDVAVPELDPSEMPFLLTLWAEEGAVVDTDYQEPDPFEPSDF